MSPQTRAQRHAAKRILAAVAQSRWIEEHGDDEAGYIARYGADDDPARSGDGGRAIYQADMDRLADILTGRAPV